MKRKCTCNTTYIFKPHDGEHNVWESGDLLDIHHLTDSQVDLDPRLGSKSWSHVLKPRNTLCIQDEKQSQSCGVWTRRYLLPFHLASHSRIERTGPSSVPTPSGLGAQPPKKRSSSTLIVKSVMLNLGVVPRVLIWLGQKCALFSQTWLW